MLKTNYLQILKDAWSITWKNKTLWWFGFLVTISTLGSCNFFSGENNEKNSLISKQQFLDFIQEHLSWIIVGFIAVLLIMIIFAILGIIGRGALIDSIGKNLKSETVTFKSGFREGKKNFWKFFSISFILGIFILLTIIILATPVTFLFLNENYIIGTLMAIVAFLIFIPLVILTSYLKTFGYLYGILGKLNFWSSLENAYNLFQKNILSSIIMGLIFIPINLVLCFAIILAAIPLILVFLLFAFLVYLVAGKIGAIIIGVIGGLILFLLILFAKSVYAVFAQSVWILFFHEIAKPKIAEVVAETISQDVSIEKAVPMIECEKE